jgi:hypothetical protein
MRDSAELVLVDAIRAAEAGDSEAVERNIAAVVGMGRQVASENNYLVSGLVGIAIEKLSYDVVEYILIEHTELLDDKQLASLQSEIASVHPREFLGYDGELAFQKDIIQRIYTDDGNNNGRLTLDGIRILTTYLPGFTGGNRNAGLSESLASAAGPVAVLGSSSRKQIEEVFERYAERFQADFGEPLYRKPFRDGDDWFEKSLAQLPATDLAGKMLLWQLLPAIDSCRLAGEVGQVRRNATLVALAATRYRLKNGEQPNDAQILLPAFLGSIPLDPLTGKHLCLKPAPRAFAVYAVADGSSGENSEAIELSSVRASSETFELRIQRHLAGGAGGTDTQIWPRKSPALND